MVSEKEIETLREKFAAVQTISDAYAAELIAIMRASEDHTLKILVSARIPFVSTAASIEQMLREEKQP